MYDFTQLLLALSSLCSFVSSASAAAPKCTAVTPKYPGGCGILGRVRYEDQEYFEGPSQPQIVDSLDECAELCARRVYSKAHDQLSGQDGIYCTSIEYNTRDGLCYLGELNVTEAVRPVPGSQRVFYNSNCFDCGQFCDQPYGSQLLDNGGFEDDLFGPWIATNGAVGKGHNSRKSFHCGPGVPYNAVCKLSQPMNACSKQMYAFQFDYLINARKAPVDLEFYFNEDSSAPNGFNIFKRSMLQHYVLTNNTEPGAWTTVRTYFRFGHGTHDGPGFSFPGFSRGGNYSIDNVYAARVPSNPSVKEGSQSIVQNGGFETGRLAPWKVIPFPGFKTGNFSIVSPGIKSKHGLYYRFHNDATASSSYLDQTLATKANTTYLFSFEGQVVHQEVHMVMTFGTLEKYTSYDEYWGPGNHYFSIPVAATTNTTTFRLSLGDHEFPINGSILLDNFSMVELKKSIYYP